MKKMHSNLFYGDPITSQEILSRREARAARQQALLAAYGAPVICICANMPGAVKQNAASRQIVAAGEAALGARLRAQGIAILHEEREEASTGTELLYCADAPAEALKALCVALEEAHPIGRLLDLDVIGAQGPVSRRELGHPPRGCLVCGRPAAVCTGRAPHPLEEVQAAIAALLEGYHAD